MLCAKLYKISAFEKIYVPKHNKIGEWSRKYPGKMQSVNDQKIYVSKQNAIGELSNE